MNQKITYYIFCLIGIIIAFNVASISAIVPSMAKDLAISEFVTGKIIWAYMIPYGICALLYGPLSRKFNIKRIIIVCLGLFSFFSLLSGLAHTFRSLFIYRLIVGIFASAMTPLALLYIAHTFDLKTRGRAVGTFFSITFISSLIGLFLSGVINWRWIFLIPAIISAVTVILIVNFFPSIKIETEGRRSRYIQALKTKKILRVFLYIFSISFLYHLARQWMGVYFDNRYHLSQFVISSLLTLVSFAGIFGEFFGGIFADKKGRIFTLTMGGLLMSASLLLFPVNGRIVFLAIILFIWGLGWAINHSGFSTYLTDLPKPYLQEVSSLNSSVRFISGGLGAAMGGVLMQKSFTLTFLAVGILLLMLSLSSKFILRS
ncbi:MAG: MFS transporter [Candidatus Omnitrophica bacterium]|nr:MFS transporter [Candidatus Omnitrophota bacterium]